MNSNKDEEKRYDELMKTCEKEAEEGYRTLPNGCTLYWRLDDMGQRMYFTDECGIVAKIWDVTLTASSSLLMALAVEEELKYKDFVVKKHKSKKLANNKKL